MSKLGGLWRESDEPHARGTHRAHPLAKFFSFDEAPLAAAGGNVPLSPIYVTFNLNPGQPNGGPGSGFHAEPNSLQTHNVPFTLPGDSGYSPLWLVSVYDNADFPSVHDRATALKAKMLAPGLRPSIARSFSSRLRGQASFILSWIVAGIQKDKGWP